MDAFSVNRRPRAGFTLIEMLAVVVIIGILASMIAGAAVVAQRTMKVNKIKFEIAALDMAIKSYKEKFGDYPPDFSNDAAVTAHLTRLFPRYQAVDAQGNLRWKTDLQNCGVKVSDLSGNPAAALVFWLGGLPVQSPTDSTKFRLVGFSQNPRFPFDISPASLSSRIGPFFDFDPSQVDFPRNASGQPDTSRALVYYPPGSSDTDPYVYFRAKNNPQSGPYYDNQYTFQHSDVNGASTVKACMDGRSGGWAAATSFQIRAPGLDGRFGPGIQFPTGADYNKFQFDDLANFCGRTFEDEIPQ